MSEGVGTDTGRCAQHGAQSVLCGYAVTDADGEQGPCDRPATGHRWYQDVEHEDMLAVACEMHRNNGGDLIASLLAKLARVEALADAEVLLTREQLRAALAEDQS